MKKQNRYLFRVIHIIGFVAFIAGVILVISQKEAYYGWLVVAGILVTGFTSPYKTIYVCPKCGTKFESKDKIILITSHNSIIKRSLATCPKCKKHSFADQKAFAKKRL